MGLSSDVVLGLVVPLHMLPDNLFIDLIDVNLQKRIGNCETLDKDATDALALLIDQGPTTVKNQLND